MFNKSRIKYPLELKMKAIEMRQDVSLVLDTINQLPQLTESCILLPLIKSMLKIKALP